MEGVMHGIPALAVSSFGKARETLNYASAGRVVKELIKSQDMLAEFLSQGLLNINVPNLPFEQIKGLRVAGLGKRMYDEEMQEGTDPRGRPYYWIGAGGEMFADIENSDCSLLDQGYVTMSVLRPSLLDEQSNARLEKRISDRFEGLFK